VPEGATPSIPERRQTQERPEAGHEESFRQGPPSRRNVCDRVGGGKGAPWGALGRAGVVQCQGRSDAVQRREAVDLNFPLEREPALSGGGMLQQIEAPHGLATGIC